MRVRRILDLHASAARIAIVLVVGFALEACASEPLIIPAPSEAELLPAMDVQPPPPSDTCRLEGCCAGRGEKAYLQSDWYVMCPDGLPSDVCDCH